MEQENKNTPATRPSTPEQALALRLNSEVVKKKFEEMGSSLAFAKEVAFATQAVQKNNILMNCNPVSIITSLFNVSLTGITLNPILGYAYLVPRKVNGVFECCLDVSYKGLIQILTNSGGVKNMYAHVVYEKDVFSIEYGAEPRLVHKPHLGGSKGKVTGVYGIAVLADGEKSFDYMDIEEINYIKGRSEMGKRGSGPWTTDFNEMAKKTILKRMFKYLPKNDTLMRVAEAIAIDNDNNGIDFEAEKKVSEANSKKSRVEMGIADAIKKSTSSDAVTEEDVLKLDEALSETEVKEAPPVAKKITRKKALSKEEVLKGIEDATNSDELAAFIDSLPTTSLTNEVYDAASKRDDEFKSS